MKRYVVNTKRLFWGATFSIICFLLAFESIQGISIKDGLLKIEQRHLWSLVKNSKIIPVLEIASVEVSRSVSCKGGGATKVFICFRNGEEVGIGGGRSLGNKAFKIREVLNDCIEKGCDLDEIFILEYTLMFGIAIIGCVFTFLVSIVKNSI
jgi:hypothetical protein